MPQQNQPDKAFPISVEEVVVSGLFDQKSLRPTRSQKDRASRGTPNGRYAQVAKRAIGTLS